MCSGDFVIRSACTCLLNVGSLEARATQKELKKHIKLRCGHMSMNYNIFRDFPLPFLANPTCRFHFLREGSVKRIRIHENTDRNMSFLNYTAGNIFRFTRNKGDRARNKNSRIGIFKKSSKCHKLIKRLN